MRRDRAFDSRIGLVAAALTLSAAAVWAAGPSVPPGVAILFSGLAVAVLSFGALSRPALALAAVAVVLVAGNTDGPLGVPLARILALGAVAVVLTARLGGQGRRIGRSPVLLAMAVLVAAALLSTLSSVDLGRSLRQDVGYVTGLLLASAIVMATGRRSDLLLVAVALCVGGGVLCGTSLVPFPDLRVETSDAALVTNRPVGVFAQPNELGLCAAMTVCLSVALIVVAHRLRRPWMTGLCVAAAVPSLVALAVSLSRGAWIGTMVGLVLLAALLREARPLLLCLGTVVMLTLGLFATAPSFTSQPVVVQRLTSVFGGPGNPYDERPSARAEAIVQMSENPVLGSGPGAFRTATYQGAAHVAAARQEEHAHNLFLAVGAEQGVLGGAALVVAIGTGAAAALANRGRPEAPADLTSRGVSAAAAASLAAVIGHGLVDYPLRNPVIGIMAWFFIGLLAASARSRPPATGRTRLREAEA
ncbi:O-antigen ligase family protein [Streptomyces sp. NBC_00028]|uniref:O-antigen ligase family protein n=1 Tax=Streptomyces sp. NBC_00028 TaxID=2975624 RepID=UPI0032508A5D